MRAFSKENNISAVEDFLIQYIRNIQQEEEVVTILVCLIIIGISIIDQGIRTIFSNKILRKLNKRENKRMRKRERRIWFRVIRDFKKNHLPMGHRLDCYCL
jgi:hypothetical protein